MKTLLITTIFPPGGGGAAVVHHQLCKELGGEAYALVPATDQGEASRFDAEQPFPVVRLRALAVKPGQGWPRRLRALWNITGKRLLPRLPLALSLVRHFRRLRPEVVCLAGLSQLYWTLPLIRRTTRARVVFYIHGEEVSAYGSYGAVSRWLFSRSIAALRQADTVVCVSGWTRRRVLELGVAPERAKVVYNGLDHQRFFPGPPDEAVRARHRLAGKRTILTVARLDPRKGHETVLRAIPRVLKEIPNLAYVIVGDGPQRAVLEGLVASLGIGKHVVFVRGVGDAEIPAYYRTCELFVQPNRRMPDGDDEGFGLVFLEAGACRRPVIGGRSGGVPEAVVDGETGILVDGNSVDETAAAIIRLLADPELSTRMAAEGWSRSQRFDWRETAARFRAVCSDEGRDVAAAAGSRRPAGARRLPAAATPTSAGRSADPPR